MVNAKEFENKAKDFLSNISDQNFALSDCETFSNKYLRYSCFDFSNAENINDIQEGMKTLDELYIPGTSLKGAITSALLYNKFDVASVTKKDSRGNYHINYKKYNHFVDMLFNVDNVDPSPQKNIMKHLVISDTNSLRHPQIYKIKTIKAKPGGSESHKKKNGKDMDTFVETIGLNKKLKFTLNNKIRDDFLIEENLENKKSLISLRNIKKSIFNFSADFIEHELEYAKRYKLYDMAKRYESLKEDNEENNPLLKVGSGSGLLLTTLGLKIKNFDSDLWEEMRPKKNTYPYEYPKSRKLIRGKTPIGWIQLDFKKKS